MKMKRLVIIWNVTENCNVGCRFCSYGGDGCVPARNADRDEIVRLGAFFRDYARQRHREILVSWIGGEPFLWEPLLPLSRLFHGEYGLRQSATTNGLPLESKDIRQTILDCFDEIAVSVDGLEKFNDWCRDCKGLFQNVKENICLLRDEKIKQGKNLRIAVNTILMRGNIGQFEELCNVLCDCGVEAVTFNQLGGRDRPEFYLENSLLPEQAASFAKEFPRIKAAMLKKGLLIHGSADYLERIMSLASGKKIAVADCKPGHSFLFISETGVISPCRAAIGEYGVPVSEISSADDIADLETRFKAMRSLKPSKSCEDCLCMQVFGKFAK